jgi:hypothetical protein
MLLLLALLCTAACGSGSKVASVTPSTRVGRLISAGVAHEERRGGNPGMGPIFCRAGYMGGKTTGHRVRFYIWDACQQYAARNHHLVEGVGWSAPATIIAVATANGYRIVDDFQANYLPQDMGEYPDPKVRAQIRILDSGESTGSISPAAMFAAIKLQAQRELLGR